MSSQSDTGSLPSPDYVHLIRSSFSDPGTSVASTSKTIGKNQAELSSQSDTEDLPSLDHVDLIRSSPIVAPTPVPSTSKAKKRPMNPTERKRASRARNKAKKATFMDDTQSTQSDSPTQSPPPKKSQ